jgi:signal transduction histidine kinase/ActR/RegA family two-component response regulator
VTELIARVAGQHDPGLVLTALAFCACAFLIAGRLYAQASREARFFRHLWIGATGAVAGTGAWATHLLGLMALRPADGAHFNALLVAFGWLAAMAAATAAAAFSVKQRGHSSQLASGALLGIGFAAMQGFGFAALEPAGHVHWHGEQMTLWAVLGVCMAMAGVWLASLGDSWKWRAASAAAFTGSVALIQFAGVSAMRIEPGAAPALDDLALSTPILATIAIFLLHCTEAVCIGAMVVAARSQVQALGDLREAIEALPAGLAFYDREDRCIIFNGAYKEFSGSCAHLLRPGVTFRELIEVQIEAGDLPAAFGRGEEWIVERLAQRRAGTEPVEQECGGRWLRVEDRRTETGGTISIIHDVTDLKKSAEALAHARDEAHAANRAKSEFLANMSHELRTPLNGVIGVAQALATTRMTPRQREMLRMVESSALTLQGVLADVLDLARIESGRVKLASERFSLDGVVRDAASLWRLEAEKKGIRLDIDIETEAEGEVCGDQVRIRQIVVNLLSNAVKFTEKGAVSANLRREAAKPEDVVLEVRDTGIGFEPEVAERLFQRFEQADGSVTRRFGGTGLGLAICRDLVERMGGSIRASGRPGEGACFRVELPLPKLEPLEAQACSQEARPAAGGRGIRVLAAEDHPINRKVIEFILEAAGVDLACAADGAEALELYRTQAFDAVLMDMQMPVMDGLSATRAIREWEAAEGRARTPVIMVTAHAMPEHLAAAREAGADCHLTKPIAAAELLAMLDELTGGASSEEEPIAAAA